MLTVKGMQQRVDVQQVTPTTVWQISPFHSLVFRSILQQLRNRNFNRLSYRCAPVTRANDGASCGFAIFRRAARKWPDQSIQARLDTYVVKLPTSRLARNHFPVARDLGVVERMLRSQVRAAIFTVGLPRPRCTEDTSSGC